MNLSSASRSAICRPKSGRLQYNFQPSKLKYLFMIKPDNGTIFAGSAKAAKRPRLWGLRRIE